MHGNIDAKCDVSRSSLPLDDVTSFLLKGVVVQRPTNSTVTRNRGPQTLEAGEVRGSEGGVCGAHLVDGFQCKLNYDTSTHSFLGYSRHAPFTRHIVRAAHRASSA